MIEKESAQGVANVLSTLTILSSLFLKVPQIIYIRQKKSAEGIYIQAMLMEIFGFSIMTLYNFTNQYGVMTYLEYPIILVQVYVMTYYVLLFKGMMPKAIVPITALVYLLIVLGFVSGILPKTILAFLVPFCSPLSGFAKVTYIYGIIKDGNADAVSLTTWIISVCTNVARIFTVYVDSGDNTLMANFLISGLLSSAVLGTALYYKTKTKKSRRGSDCRPKQRRKSSSRRYED